MTNPTRLALVLILAAAVWSPPRITQAQDAASVRFGESALAFAAGAIQKTTPRDGIVNLVTGDNQTTGNRMILGKLDQLYLKLDHPEDAAVGDLFTIYRRVRKVFHPSTREYLGFVTIRLAVVKVVQVDPNLTTVEVVRSYGTISPGDLVMRFSPPPAAEESTAAADVSNVSGMIAELQSDKTMTLVSQGDVVYVDRGREDGVKPGDLMDLHRKSPGLPSRKIGQLKILSAEDRTATAKIVKANTRVMRGDTFQFTGTSSPLMQPVEPPLAPQSSQAIQAKADQAPVSADLVASKLKVQDAAGESRINLGELTNSLRYDSGEAAIKPESYKVLDQLIEYLRTSGDERLVRVEGHADNVEIGPSLKSRYPSNWELSKARASGVVRYLVEKGGLDSARLSSVGYGDSRPAATNANEEGRTKNRRVEILLYAPQTEPTASKESARPAQAGRAAGPLSAREAGVQVPAEVDSQDAGGAGTLSVGRDQLPADGPDTNSPSDQGGKTASDPALNQDAVPPSGAPQP
jgi:chemotaxis protein MotB